MLDKQLEKLLEEHRPDCLVEDIFFSRATDVVAEYGIPTVIFMELVFLTYALH